MLVQPGAYEAGFQSVQLDGTELPVSDETVVLIDGSTVLRSSSSVLKRETSEVSVTLVNSDHFINIHSAMLHSLPADIDHVHGLLGQTASTGFTVERTADFTQHIESDFMLPEGEDDIWSTQFEHNQYVQTASAN